MCSQSREEHTLQDCVTQWEQPDAHVAPLDQLQYVDQAAADLTVRHRQHRALPVEILIRTTTTPTTTTTYMVQSQLNTLHGCM